MSTTTKTEATIEHVNPADLVIGANVRLDAKTDAAFLASIRERGVLVPVVAHRDTTNEDRLTVLYGQRRTLAANAGRPREHPPCTSWPPPTTHHGSWTSWARTTTEQGSPRRITSERSSS